MSNLNPYHGIHKNAFIIERDTPPEAQGYRNMRDWRGLGKKRKPKSK